MPVNTYLPPAVGQGFSGSVVLASPTAYGGSNTSYAFANALVSDPASNNKSYPALVDGQFQAHNVVPGKREGALTFTCAVTPDRDLATFLTESFGPRDTGGNLPAFVAAVTPFQGAGTAVRGLIYPNQVTLYGGDGQRGQDLMVMMQVQCIVIDSDNFLQNVAPALPTYVGTNGAGISSFVDTWISPDGTTGNAYDVLEKWSLTLNNRYKRIPGVIPGTRLGAGCKPGQLIGAFTIGQTQGAVRPVPMAASSSLPMTLKIPTGDLTHTLTAALALSDDDTGRTIAPERFVTRAEAYTVFGSNAGNGTGAAKFPVLFTYA